MAIALGNLLVPILVAVGMVMFIMFFVVVTRNYHKVPPSLAAVVSGRHHEIVRDGPDGKPERIAIGFRVVRGGSFFQVPVLERVDYLSLEVIPISLAIKKAYTKEGVPVTVEAVANVKIDSAQESLISAAERFLGMKPERIKDLIFQTLEGHLRAILGTLTVEEINNNRQAFGQKVTDEAAVDLRRMGVAIDSIVIQTINDESGYLDSLGKRRTAEVKRDAQIGEAEALRDASIRSAQARQEGEQARLASEQAIAQSQRDLGVKQAQFESEVNAAKAKASQQGPLASALADQDVVAAKIKVKEIEAERQAEVAVKEAALRERQLVGEVIKPAEAKRDAARIHADGEAVARVRQAEGQRDAATIEAEGEKQKIARLAEAERARLLAVADGESQRIQKTGEAEASAVKARALAEAEGRRAALLAEAEGRKATLLAEAEALRAKLEAEADGLQKKADAYKQFNQAAVMQTVLERLPTIIAAAEPPLRALGESIGKPLSAIDRVSIVDLGGGGNGDGAAGASAAMLKFANVVPAMLFGLAENARALGVKVPGLESLLGEVKEAARATGDEAKAVVSAAEEAIERVAGGDAAAPAPDGAARP
jgi:flotillin